MSWRIVVISKRAKLELKMNDMLVRGDEVYRIHLSEISTIIVENTAVSLTASLLVECSKRKIKVVFCDEKRNPMFETMSYYGSHDTSLKVKLQTGWAEQIRGEVWTEIVREKIKQQVLFLSDCGYQESGLLEGYLHEMKFNDSTNREGHAAKVYFNALFGKQFSRAEDSPVNAALNYGYSIILSAVNREIVASGYITQIGLFHDNRFNMYNLGSDLMEPFRPMVDRLVYRMNPVEFEQEEKMQLVNILNQEINIDGKNQYLNNAVRIYCKSIFDSINNRDVSLLRFCQYEL